MTKKYIYSQDATERQVLRLTDKEVIEFIERHNKQGNKVNNMYTNDGRVAFEIYRPTDVVELGCL